jgi:fucose permease
VTDPLLLSIHDRRQSLHININHFFVTLGSILITLYLIYLEMDWRNALAQSAAAVLVLAAFYGLTRLPNRGAPAESYRRRLRALTREPLVVALFAATALVVGLELGTAGILTTYLMELRGFSQTTSKLGLVTFLGGIASGRIVVGFLGRMEHLRQTILALFASAAVSFGLLFAADLGSWSYGVIFLAGLSISALLPLMVTLAGVLYPTMAGMVIGAIKVAIPVGGILMPMVMALLTRQGSLEAAVLIYPAAAGVALAVLATAFRGAGQPATAGGR